MKKFNSFLSKLRSKLLLLFHVLFFSENPGYSIFTQVFHDMDILVNIKLKCKHKIIEIIYKRLVILQ